MREKRVAIIGAGFSGSLLVHHLVHNAPFPLTLYVIDKSPNPGEGVAYSTTNPHHLLNVRAEKMTAHPDQPDHFVTWLKEAEPHWRKLAPELASLTLHPQDFAPRMVFGSYIKSQLQAAISQAPIKGHQLHFLTSSVKDIEVQNGQCHVMCEKESLQVDAVILALGSLPPRGFAYEKKLSSVSARFARNVWQPAAGNILHPHCPVGDKDAKVAIIGSGLTMIDTVISLHDKGFQGQIIAFSRHGHMPHIHTLYTPYPRTWSLDELSGNVLELLRLIRAEIRSAGAKGYHWQAVIDSLRPITNPLWQRFSVLEKRVFLRHLFSLWNIHRHRMAPESAAIITSLQKRGQLIHRKGSIKDVDPHENGLVISYREKYVPEMQKLEVSYLLNCTGPEVDIRKAPADHLVQRLYERQYVTLDALHAGLEQEKWQVKGKAAGYLFAMGPLCFGPLFETIAVPELRVQAKELAHELLHQLQHSRA